MRFALLALVLPALAGGGDDAKKTFRALEKKLVQAKSLHVVADIVAKEKTKEAKLHISITLAEGNKARMTVKGTADGKDVGMELISNGKSLSMVETASGKGKGKDMDTPDRFSETVATVVSRLGLIGGFRSTVGRKGKDGKAPDVDKLIGVHDLKMGEAEKVDGREAKVIHYEVKIRNGREEEARVTLWLDAKTLLPLKRLIQVDKDRVQITETYSEFKLNPKVDAKTFEVAP
jgi:outer membrane lipoprotein-sorting protein